MLVNSEMQGTVALCGMHETHRAPLQAMASGKSSEEVAAMLAEEEEVAASPSLSIVACLHTGLAAGLGAPRRRGAHPPDGRLCGSEGDLCMPTTYVCTLGRYKTNSPVWLVGPPTLIFLC